MWRFFLPEAQTFDLFGLPVRSGKGARGRPSFERTEKDANKVRLLLALGWSNQRIANAIGCSLATLKRHFRAELKVRDQMRDRLEARQIEVAAEQAMSGNVAAMKRLQELIDRSDAKVASSRLTSDVLDDDEETPKPKKLGKKEAAQQSAQSAGEGTGWGDDLLFRGGDKAH